MKHHMFCKPAIALALAITLLTNAFSQAAPAVDIKQLPHIMRFCGPVRCGTLTLTDGRYVAVWDDGKAGDVPSYFTVESFSPRDVRLKRKDANGGNAVLSGIITPQGDRVVNGKQVYVDEKGKPLTTTGFNLGWVQSISAKGAPSVYSPNANIQNNPLAQAFLMQLLMSFMPGGGESSSAPDSNRMYKEYRDNVNMCQGGNDLACGRLPSPPSRPDDH